MPIAPWLRSPGVPAIAGIVQQFTGVAAVYWNDPAGIALLAQQLGATRSPLFIWDTGTDPVNIAAVLAGDELYVWTDGTQTLIPQAVGDIVGTLGTRYTNTELIVHSFFYECALQLLRWLLQYYPQLTLLKRITLSGHSYGAASCGILQLMLLDLGTVRPEICLFASPRWCAKPASIRHDPGIVLNMHGALDVIPYLPGDLVEGFIPIELGQAIYHGRSLRWEDYTAHWVYSDNGPVQFFREAPFGLLGLNPLLWGPQHKAVYHIEQIAAWYGRELGDPAGNPLLAYMLGLSTQPVPSTPPPSINNLTGPQVEQLQEIYFPQPQDPRITLANYREIGQNTLEQVTPAIDSGSIIPPSTPLNLGAASMPLSGYKCTAFFGVGEWGWSHTFYTAATDFTAVQGLFAPLLDQIVLCMGTEPGISGDVGGGPSTVTLDYVRYQPLSGLGAPTLRGPLSRRNSTAVTGFGYGSNMPSTAIFNTLTVSTVISGQTVKGTRQFFLHGVPDIIVEGIKYKPSNSGQFNSNIQALWSTLQAAGSPWTMLVRDPTAANGYIQGGAISGGRWVLQYNTAVPGSLPLAVGDRIRLTRADPSVFNGSWVVASINTAVTPNLMTLASGPPLGTVELKNAKWIKIYDNATKSPQLAHVSFNSNPQWKTLAPDTSNYLVRQHKVGGRYRPIRGSKKRKRQTI